MRSVSERRRARACARNSMPGTPEHALDRRWRWGRRAASSTHNPIYMLQCNESWVWSCTQATGCHTLEVPTGTGTTPSELLCCVRHLPHAPTHCIPVYHSPALAKPARARRARRKIATKRAILW